ncbi:MAG: peptidase S41 [Gammaproteobacteria bacterium]|nr:peptidase S41 [Gammaproteobacteria bacterium]
MMNMSYFTKKFRLFPTILFMALSMSLPNNHILSQERVPAENIEQFVDIFSRIKEQYVDEVDDQKLFNLAIKGMVSGLDPHSSFLSSDDFNELKIGTTGKFGGLGIEITTEDGFVKVISPIDDTPAQRAGIKAGDLITKVDETSLKDMEIGDAVKLMRGEPGTKTIITVIRKGEKSPLTFNITRQIIVSKGIKTNMFDNVGYVRLSSFQSNSTGNLKSAIYKLKKTNPNMTSMVLDLRNNPGGVLGAAVGITDLFLQQGKIVYTNGRTINSKLEYFATPQDILNGLPLFVLINEGSASASEIVAGALQDNKRATIMGTKSYGKASVQTIQELSDGSALKLTTAKYFTPLGRDIHTNGIKPDVEVKYDQDKLVALPTPYDKDNQLFETLSIINKKNAAKL